MSPCCARVRGAPGDDRLGLNPTHAGALYVKLCLTQACPDKATWERAVPSDELSALSLLTGAERRKAGGRTEVEHTFGEADKFGPE